MPRTRDEAAFEAKRRRILRAAEALFVERGFHQTGMAAICEAAGMSPGALYRYFPSKTEIIRAFVAEERAETAALFDRLEGAKDFRKALTDFLWETIQAVGDKDYARLALEIAAEGARDPEVGAILAESDAEAHRRLTAIIEAAQARGKAPRNVDASAVARLLLMVVDGATGNGGRIPAASKRTKFPETLEQLTEGLLGSS